MSKSKLLGFLAFVLAANVLPLSDAFAADAAPPRFNQIHFQVERSRPVDNDRMQTILGVTAEDDDTARLADKINNTMGWALKLAKAQPKLDVRSGNYQTNQIYDERRAKRWRATQELILESAVFALMSGVVGKLQERMQVTAMRFFISPERRAKVEDELIAQALDAFKQRAELVRAQLKAAGYRIVDASIAAAGGPPTLPMHGFEMARTASVEQPAVEAGTSKIGVSVSGVIELQ